jgi:hypothetical protein
MEKQSRKREDFAQIAQRTVATTAVSQTSTTLSVAMDRTVSEPSEVGLLSRSL